MLRIAPAQFPSRKVNYLLPAVLVVAIAWASPSPAQFAGSGGNVANTASAAAAMQGRIGGVPAGANVDPETAAKAQQMMMLRNDLNRDGVLSAQETMYAMKRGGGMRGGNAGAGMGAQGMLQQMNQQQQMMNQQALQAANNQQNAADPDDVADQARKARAAAKKKPAKKSLVSKFDQDGDGKLNAEEKAAAKAAISKRQK